MPAWVETQTSPAVVQEQVLWLGPCSARPNYHGCSNYGNATVSLTTLDIWSDEGSSTLVGTWPAGVPVGTKIYAQHWIVDGGGAGSLGFASSNAIEGEAQ